MCKFYARYQDSEDRETNEQSVIRCLKGMCSDLQLQGDRDCQILASDDPANHETFEELTKMHTEYGNKWKQLPAKTKKEQKQRAMHGFRYILTGLFFKVAVVRPGTIAGLQISSGALLKEDAPQQIDLSTDGEVFLEYRGSSSFKSHREGDDMRIKVADTQFSKDVHLYANRDRAILLNGQESNVFLFGPNTKACMSTSTFSKHFKAALTEFADGKNIGPRMTRHIAVTSLLSDKNLALTSLESIAKVMQHSVPAMKKSYDLRSASDKAQAGVQILHERAQVSAELPENPAVELTAVVQAVPSSLRSIAVEELARLGTKRLRMIAAEQPSPKRLRSQTALTWGR